MRRWLLARGGLVKDAEQTGMRPPVRSRRGRSRSRRCVCRGSTRHLWRLEMGTGEVRPGNGHGRDEIWTSPDPEAYPVQSWASCGLSRHTDAAQAVSG